MQQRPSQRAIGDFPPKLVQLTDEVLYGDAWERPQLPKRDRSLVTVAALLAMNRPDQLRSHFAHAYDETETQATYSSSQVLATLIALGGSLWSAAFRS